MGVEADWWDSLPDVGNGGIRPATVAGFLVAAPPGVVRVLVRGVCLDFLAADIQQVTEQDPEQAGASSRRAVPVEVTLRSNARLLAVHDARALRTAATAGQAPFAFASRPSTPVIPAASKYAAVEAAYLRRWNLADPS